MTRLTGKNKGPGGYLKSLVIQQIVNFIYRKNEKAINHFVGKLTNKALRKIHVLDEPEPAEEEMEELDDAEEEENAEMHEAKTEDPEEEKEKKEPTKNKNLTDPTPGPGKDAEE